MRDFSKDQELQLFMENLAVCDEDLLERYIETGTIETNEIGQLIGTRKTFPCHFGSALDRMV